MTSVSLLKKFICCLVWVTAISLIISATFSFNWLTTESNFNQLGKSLKSLFTGNANESIEALLEEDPTGHLVYLSNPDAYKYSENRKYAATSRTELNCKQRPLNLKGRKGTKVGFWTFKKLRIQMFQDFYSLQM